MAAEHVGNGPRRPDPDPTILTTKQLNTGLRALRELIETRIDGSIKTLETRLDGGDKAVELLQGTASKMPSIIGSAVDRLQELHEEKFNSIKTQFTERDTRTEQLALAVEKRTDQLSMANATAISAALLAQKEDASAKNESNATATSKMEANFANLIEQGRELVQTVKQNTDTQINDLKSRLDKGEGRTRGLGDGWGYFVGAIGAAAAVSTIVAVLIK